MIFILINQFNDFFLLKVNRLEDTSSLRGNNLVHHQHEKI